MDNSAHAMISRGKEWLRDIRPPQESLIVFHQQSGILNSIRNLSTLFYGPSNIAGPGSCQSPFCLL
jgi:hypothetical protein